MKEFRIGDIIDTIWGDERSTIVSEPLIESVTLGDGEQYDFVDCYVLNPYGKVVYWGYTIRETVMGLPSW